MPSYSLVDIRGLRLPGFECGRPFFDVGVEMLGRVLPGAALAIAGGLIVLVGSWLSLDLEPVALLGAAAGGVVGLVPDRSPLARVVGFAAGLAIAWAGYGVRAALLPDTAGGRAVAVFVVMALVTVVAAATLGRLPLWSLLVGVVAMVGSYEELYAASPSQFLTTSPSAATTVLLAASIGFVASALLGAGAGPARRATDAERTDDESVVA